ncbi:MAG: methyltransferase domain-containing protein [Deltaproteobacteria bacterium]|nr:methyltransferase domain-containing protein [Deltaproteobacteria bacterium]
MKAVASSNLLVCPACRTDLTAGQDGLVCHHCQQEYPVKNGIPIFYPQGLTDADDQKEAGYWNKKDNTTDNLYENMTDGAFRSLVDRFGLPDNTRGLELGCGDGPFAKRLTNRNMDIYGLDISFPLLNLTENMKPVQGSALDLPFRDMFFNWIIYAFALHHMIDLEKALKESLRVLDIGGKICIVEPNYYHPVRFITRRPDTMLRQKFFSYLSPEERWIPMHRLNKILQANGVTVTEYDFVTPEFKSRTLSGRIQKTLGRLFNFFPAAAVTQSYYLVIGTKHR